MVTAVADRAWCSLDFDNRSRHGLICMPGTCRAFAGCLPGEQVVRLFSHLLGTKGDVWLFLLLSSDWRSFKLCLRMWVRLFLLLSSDWRSFKLRLRMWVRGRWHKCYGSNMSTLINYQEGRERENVVLREAFPFPLG